MPTQEQQDKPTEPVKPHSYLKRPVETPAPVPADDYV